jgi:hypothetical protein
LDYAYDDEGLQALFRAFVACRLALDALPELPRDIRDVVDGPIRTLCETVGPELERLSPGFLETTRWRR